jgi:hypothetical protein
MSMMTWDLGPVFSTDEWPHPPRAGAERPGTSSESEPQTVHRDERSLPPVRTVFRDYDGTVTRNGEPE